MELPRMNKIEYRRDAPRLHIEPREEKKRKVKTRCFASQYRTEERKRRERERERREKRVKTRCIASQPKAES